MHPTRETIASWHQENHQPWHGTLFPGLDGAIWFQSDKLARQCWLTKSRNCRPRAIVPLELGGPDHPRNYVLLNPGLFAKAPEEKSPDAFLAWLTDKARRKQEKMAAGLKEVFADIPATDTVRLFELFSLIEEKRIRLDSLKIEFPEKKKKETSAVVFLKKLRAVFDATRRHEKLEAALAALQK